MPVQALRMPTWAPLPLAPPLGGANEIDTTVPSPPCPMRSCIGPAAPGHAKAGEPRVPDELPNGAAAGAQWGVPSPDHWGPLTAPQAKAATSRACASARAWLGPELAMPLAPVQALRLPTMVPLPLAPPPGGANEIDTPVPSPPCPRRIGIGPATPGHAPPAALLFWTVPAPIAPRAKAAHSLSRAWPAALHGEAAHPVCG